MPLLQIGLQRRRNWQPRYIIDAYSLPYSEPAQMLQRPNLRVPRHGMQQLHGEPGTRVVPRLGVAVQRIRGGFYGMIDQFGYAGILCRVEETVIARDVIDVRMQSVTYTTETDTEEISVGG